MWELLLHILQGMRWSQVSASERGSPGNKNEAAVLDVNVATF